MMRCPRCCVSFTGDLDRCALCGAPLEGAPDPSPFPCIPIQRQSTRARRILGAATLGALAVWAVICCAVRIPWTYGVAAAAALLVGYLVTRNLMVHAPNALRAVKRVCLAVMACALIWFAATGNPVASSWAIPAISWAAILFDVVLWAVFGSRLVAEYGKYLLYDIVFGAVPPLLILTGTVAWPALSWSCAAAAAAMLAALLLVNRRAVGEEARKLFSA